MAPMFLLLVCLCCVNEISAGGKLIVVLIDGCRYDYTDDPILDLKGFRKIEETGVRATAVYPVYPALSYPNWYSIVTGLYPENHGFINNIMYDSDTDAPFLMLPNKGSTDVFWWNVTEPIWVTTEKAGKTSAMYWWAGCEVPIRGIEPMICERHRYGPGTKPEKEDFLERIDDIVVMFNPLREDQLSLALMYYGPVDYTGHYSGPKTSETRRTVQDIDEILFEMMKRLEDAGLRDEVNIMIVSDHGMVDVSEPGTKYVSLEKFAPDIKYQVATGPTSMLVPEPGMLDKLYKDIQDAKITGIEVFKKEDIPDSFHIKKSPRMNDIFIKAKKGYLIQALNDSKKRIGYPPEKYNGHHGFDPHEVSDMKTIFYATGPDFRRGYKVDNISNVDLYNVMCNILQILPLPNNGSSGLVKDILGHHNEPLARNNAMSLSINSLLFVAHYFIITFIFIKTNALNNCL